MGIMRTKDGEPDIQILIVEFKRKFSQQWQLRIRQRVQGTVFHNGGLTNANVECYKCHEKENIVVDPASEVWFKAILKAFSNTRGLSPPDMIYAHPVELDTSAVHGAHVISKVFKEPVVKGNTTVYSVVYQLVNLSKEILSLMKGVRVAIAAPAFDYEKRTNVCVIEEACRSRELHIPHVNELSFSAEVDVQDRRPTVPPTEPDRTRCLKFEGDSGAQSDTLVTVLGKEVVDVNQLIERKCAHLEGDSKEVIRKVLLEYKDVLYDGIIIIYCSKTINKIVLQASLQHTD
ncbi:hypothetical protein J6590_100428 [Homalodisca vitripennis]|nr:hypothetical protein J6590_061744 [Homalodisca vitripennis]KAG8289638.1 hypothetical protein J6590_100428 [Homalodisca vitripennis]